MKILFAVKDRDLLECCKMLLETDLGQTVTAFDGTQVLSVLSEDKFDIAVIDSDLPRIEYKKLIEQIHEKNIPAVVLINDPLNTRREKEERPADSYLLYPFNYEQLKNIITDTLDKAKKETGTV